MPESISTMSTSPSLIGRALERDAQAWDRLASLYSPLIYRWARQAGLQPQDSADIVQDAFRSVAARLNVYRDEGNGSFRAWLWGITRNALRQHFRNRAKNPPAAGGSSAKVAIEQVPDFVESDNEPESDDTRKRLFHRALRVVRGDFEDRTWQCFWRMTIDGQAATEIGRDLGMHEKAVRQAKYRVLCRIRDELSDV